MRCAVAFGEIATSGVACGRRAAHGEFIREAWLFAVAGAEVIRHIARRRGGDGEDHALFAVKREREFPAARHARIVRVALGIHRDEGGVPAGVLARHAGELDLDRRAFSIGHQLHQIDAILPRCRRPQRSPPARAVRNFFERRPQPRRLVAFLHAAQRARVGIVRRKIHRHAPRRHLADGVAKARSAVAFPHAALHADALESLYRVLDGRVFFVLPVFQPHFVAKAGAEARILRELLHEEPGAVVVARRVQLVMRARHPHLEGGGVVGHELMRRPIRVAFPKPADEW